MRVKFWGVRGSIPAPGPDTEAVGGNTSCLQVIGEDGTELILDAGSGAVKARVPVESVPRALAISPDGEDLIYTLAGVDAVQVMDLDSLQLESQIPVGASPHYPLSTPDGRLSMVVSQGPVLRRSCRMSFSRSGGRRLHLIRAAVGSGPGLFASRTGAY